MIKASKISELTNSKVVTILEQELSKYGFKYLKSKSHFIRQEKGFEQTILVYTPYSPLSYNESTDQILLTFGLSFGLKMPEYDKWYFDKFQDHGRFSVTNQNLISQVELSFDDFDNESYYSPTASEQFKRIVTQSLVNSTEEQSNIIPLNDLLQIKIPELVLNLSEKSDIMDLYNNREYPFQFLYLLVYGGYMDIAKQGFENYYQYLIKEIENLLETSVIDAKRAIHELNKLIKNIEKVTGVLYTNPFVTSVKIQSSKNDSFIFSEKTKFRETLRLDISQFDIKTINVNGDGDIFLQTDEQKVIKLNAKGELLFEKEIENKKGFDKMFGPYKSGVIGSSNNFFVGNYVLTSDNEFLELELPIQKLKKGKLQKPNIIDFVYSQKDQKYLILYENNFLVYNLNGQLEKSLNIEVHATDNRIIIDKEWIVLQKDNANTIIDFNGNKLGTYEFGNGNRYFEFSVNYDSMICFNYSTKSQYYNLANGKKGTLWAHPTFIKDYKEIMYNDTEHNFGMGIAKFSTDNKYIVGGAYHGKYVAWTYPKLERVELTPLKEMIELLRPSVVTRFSGGKTEEIVTKAELVTLDNQTFLKNRGNRMSKIFFFENADIFVTEIGYGNYVLSWGRDFKNLSYKKLEGGLDYHSQKYLTQRTKTEIIIYKQD